ncbi:hypothetical protein [Rariglobus hedericola]|uniref:Uncharacterized protein n=1 Tax=Rariglobus hedericola TaxID=2597822 RepID=A0A556QQC0_9BACT|nr:hypothetical protein [Rariglobus hedericola]TSJ78836.1 hypothetical protein FPL22_05890 [Rariglobus hedericola]
MAAKSQDKIFFGVALVLLLASAGWMALQGSKLAKLRASADASITASPYVPAGIDAPTVSTSTWPIAPSQPTGAEWVYDVFTPPEIYYNESTKKFSVTPPVTVIVEVPKEIPFGLELVSIKQDAYRLQLVGYIGGEGDYRGTFENTISGETVIGRTGKVFADLGLTIKSFTVKRNKTISPDSMPIYDTEATAVVVDSKTGEEVTLTNKRRLIKGSPLAILKTTGASETTEHKVGSKFTIGNVTYTVRNVSSEPPSAEVVKESPELKEPETKTLTPFVPVDPVPASQPATEQPATPAPATPFPFGN